MKAVVLHDYFESAEGGGRLSFELACGLGADLGYGFKVDNHPYLSSGRLQGREYQVSSPSPLPVWRQFRLARAFIRNTGFLQQYDAAMYSGFYTPLAIHQHRDRQNIYYCHTPPRYMYDQRDFFLSLIPQWQRPVLMAFNRWLRPQYEKAVQEMDVIIANSSNVQKRITKYLGLPSTIIYPPCNLDMYTWKKPKGFFLSTARLDPLKRVDVLVQAFLNMPDQRLVVVSGGAELGRIKELAEGADNIEIRGWVDEQVLHELLATCIATIYIPRDEDFGMSPVESMASGKPVLGVAEGGLLETVVPGETGVLLPADEIFPDTLCQAVSKFSTTAAMDMQESCRQRASMFSKELFLERMRSIMARPSTK